MNQWEYMVVWLAQCHGSESRISLEMGLSIDTLNGIRTRGRKPSIATLESIAEYRKQSIAQLLTQLEKEYKNYLKHTKASEVPHLGGRSRKAS